MEHMDEKNKRMQLERANHKKLSDEVQNLVVSMLIMTDTVIPRSNLRFRFHYCNQQ